MNHAEAVQRADQIGRSASSEVAEAEQNRCFSLKLRDRVQTGEFHKMLRPERYGGFGIGARTSDGGLIVCTGANPANRWAKRRGSNPIVSAHQVAKSAENRGPDEVKLNDAGVVQNDFGE